MRVSSKRDACLAELDALLGPMHKVGPPVLQSGVFMCRVLDAKKKENAGFLVSLHRCACLAELETLLGPAHEVGFVESEVWLGYG